MWDGQRKQVQAAKASCKRKRPYPTIDAAQAALEKRPVDAKDALDIYLCVWCYKFHLGHPRSKR